MTDDMHIAELTKSWADRNKIQCIYKDELSSTNDFAKTYEELTSPMLIVASHQTAGRGRNKNTWTNSPPGTCLLSTWCFLLEASPQHTSGPLIGLSLFNAAKKAWPTLSWSLKPPNDLYLHAKKIAGLLTESVTRGNRTYLYVGLGINVLAHPESEEQATHLDGEFGTGGTLTAERWNLFLDHFFETLSLATQQCLSSEMSQENRDQLLWALNLNPLKPGVFLDVSSSGDLVLEQSTIHWQDL